MLPGTKEVECERLFTVCQLHTIVAPSRTATEI